MMQTKLIYMKKATRQLIKQVVTQKKKIYKQMEIFSPKRKLHHISRLIFIYVNGVTKIK